MSLPPERGEGGFVLPLLLVVVALLGLSLMSVADALAQSRLRLERQIAQSRLEVSGATAEARLGFLLLTEPLGQRGIRVGGDRLDASGMLAPPPSALRSAAGRQVQELIFDGRLYRLDLSKRYSVELRVQDEAGLLNLNSGDEAAVGRLLERAGMPGGRARSLAASLADFVDGDDLRRLHGAERATYRRAGMEGPRNLLLRNPRTASGAYGWEKTVSARQARAIFDATTALPASQALNVNTAPVEVLEAVLGVDGRGAERIAEERENRALQSLDDATSVTGIPLAGGTTRIAGLPARHMRLQVRLVDRRRPEIRFGYETRLSVAPPEDDAPLYFRPPGLVRPIPAKTGKPEPFPRFS